MESYSKGHRARSQDVDDAEPAKVDVEPHSHENAGNSTGADLSVIFARRADARDFPGIPNRGGDLWFAQFHRDAGAMPIILGIASFHRHFPQIQMTSNGKGTDDVVYVYVDGRLLRRRCGVVLCRRDDRVARILRIDGVDAVFLPARSRG